MYRVVKYWNMFANCVVFQKTAMRHLRLTILMLSAFVIIGIGSIGKNFQVNVYVYIVRGTMLPDSKI